MALTAQQFQTWLESPGALRCMLVHVTVNIGGVETTKYLSNRNYVTTTAFTDSFGTVTPANTTYEPILKSSVKFTENLETSGGGSLSYGDIAINNTNGEYDSWLQGAWQGRGISIYIGDVNFARGDFTRIFSGIVADISSSDRNTLNLQLRDILQKLNTPITSNLLGNYYQGAIVATTTYDNPNKEQVKPLVFGEVFNITPLLIDPTRLEFMVHDGPIESIIEVRDNGVPLALTTGYTVDLTKGTFKLLNQPAGTVTCSVQGDKNTIYNTTIVDIIKRIIKNYGNPAIAGAITDSDIDSSNFTAFNTAHPHPVGIFISAKDNVIDVCQRLANSVGAQLVASKAGLLKLLKITVPTTGTTTITDEDIVQYSLSVARKMEVQATYKVGFCKNWTVQENLLTGIPSDNKELMSGEWFSRTHTNTTNQALYKLNALPEQKDTLLITDAKLLPADPDGQVLTEAKRLVALWGVQRYTYRLTATSGFFQSQLGDMITLKHRRFGLNSGVAAQVVSSEIDWDTGYINLEVLV